MPRTYSELLERVRNKCGAQDLRVKFKDPDATDDLILLTDDEDLEAWISASGMTEGGKAELWCFDP